MSDLISRQAAIDVIREMSPVLFSAYQHNAYVDKQEVMIRLMALQSAQSTTDVRENVHGRWISDEDGNIECSVCGHHGVGDLYCERCGAKMDGKETEDVEIHN